VIGGALTRRALVLGAALVMACRRDPPGPEVAPDAAPSLAAPVVKSAPVDRWSEAGMLEEAALYLDEPEFRRAQLVASLVNPANTYSGQRLGSYGLRTKGWDLLPAWNPRSLPVTTETARALRAGSPPSVGPETPPLWDGQRPGTMPEWVALGREVFFRYPLRVEVFMDWALANPDLGERVGVRADAAGIYAGVVQFRTVDGKSALGITCAICHTSLEDGRFVAGAARREFDYGALRLAYHASTKTYVEPDLARRMKTWGPGRADVTEDDDEDPVAIPDLWGLRHQTFLTQAGTIAHVGPTALAIRQETQLLHSNHQKVRPPRELAYALAMYLYSLEPPRAAPAKDDRLVARGRDLFTSRCRGCHENEAYGGAPVAAAKIGTDAALANGGARGTGTYRPPALLRVGAAGPYFHHGAVPTLEDVLSPARLDASYAKSPLRKGAVPGHTYGLDLGKSDRAAVVAYLRTL
jgi:mono/diheme cytochrome c family protein